MKFSRKETSRTSPLCLTELNLCFPTNHLDLIIIKQKLLFIKICSTNLTSDEGRSVSGFCKSNDEPSLKLWFLWATQT